MLYITYKTEHFSHKSGCAMWFTKHLEETSLQCYSKNLALNNYILLLKSVATKAQEYEVCSKLKI